MGRHSIQLSPEFSAVPESLSKREQEDRLATTQELHREELEKEILLAREMAGLSGVSGDILAPDAISEDMSRPPVLAVRNSGKHRELEIAISFNTNQVKTIQVPVAFVNETEVRPAEGFTLEAAKLTEGMISELMDMYKRGELPDLDASCSHIQSDETDT